MKPESEAINIYDTEINVVVTDKVTKSVSLIEKRFVLCSRLKNMKTKGRNGEVEWNSL